MFDALADLVPLAFPTVFCFVLGGPVAAGIALAVTVAAWYYS